MSGAVYFFALVVLVHYASARQPCSTQVVTEGQTGSMIFFFKDGINFTNDKVFAHLRRSNNPTHDILLCDQGHGTMEMECFVRDPHFKIDAIQHHTLVVLVPKITRNFDDTYVFQVYVNSTAESPDFCPLVVKDAPQSHGNYTWIAAPVLVLFFAIVIVVAVYLVQKRRNMTSNQDQDNHLEQGANNPLLLRNDQRGTETFSSMRWYFGTLGYEEEEKLLKSSRNGEGSFLVRLSNTNPVHLVLSVCFDGEILWLTFLPQGAGWKCDCTNDTFPNICEVVNKYRQEEIVVNGNSWGKLRKPCEKDPDDNWFVRKLTEADEKKLFASRQNGPGSFFVRDSNRSPGTYCLTVKSDGGVFHYGIIPEDSGYRMIDIQKVFKSLPELVEHCQANGIPGDPQKIKLLQPCSKEPPEEWFFKTFTKEDEDTFLQSKRTRPGSFLIQPLGQAETSYSLAVFFEGEMRRFTVKKDGNGFRFLPSNMLFYTWYELVNYYKEHDIQVGDKIWGKLSRPFWREPEEDWYFGNLSKEEESRLHKANKKNDGMFLIRDGRDDPDNYVLAVNIQGNLVHFTVIPEETGFRLVETGEEFKDLAELVERYKDHEIEGSGATSCRLSGPFQQALDSD